MGCCTHGMKDELYIKKQASKFGYDIPDSLPSISTDKHSKVTEMTLEEQFGIGLDRARATLRSTTQKGIRSAIMPLSRCYKTDRIYFTKRLMGKFATYTLFYKTKTLHKNIGSQIFSHMWVQSTLSSVTGEWGASRRIIG